MLKTILKITALSVVSLTLLTACGLASRIEDELDKVQDDIDNETDRLEDDLDRIADGNGNSGNGNSGNVNTPPSSSAVAVADGVASVRQAGPYSNAGTFVPRNSSLSLQEQSARELDDSYSITTSESQDTFALAKSGNNIVMTVNGTAYTFTPNEIVAAVPPSNGNPARPATYEWNAAGAGQLSGRGSYGVDLRTILDGTHPTIQGTYVQYFTNPDLAASHIDINLDYTTGFATVGMQTPTSVVASQTATATYRGSVSLDVQSNFTKTANQDNASSSVNGSSTEYLSGGDELTMTVNFTNNTIEGEATYTVFSVGTNQIISNREPTITFNSAPIVGNGFAGTFSMDSDYRNVLGVTNNPTGNYAGNFFGPAADDIAGVMRFDAQGSAIGLGGFRGDRQDPAQ